MSLRRHKSVQHLSALFSKIFAPTLETTEGLYWLSVWSADGSLDSGGFQDVLQRLVVPHLLKDEGVSLVWRLQNASPAARGGNAQNGQRPQHGGPCALIVRMQDIEMLWTSQALQKLAAGRRDGDQIRIFGTEAKTYELVQRFEGKREHLAMIAATPVHVRTTRYKLRTGLVHGANDGGSTMLALHECTSAKALLDYAIQHGQIVKETPWSKRVFTTAQSVERTIWDVTGRFTEVDGKLDKL
ncbi:hypothetical protein LTR02_007629 [Friedmanniomyces endolithicus]|nr:hypothetical protein LTR94_017974 [Friedmanniomyces endolithicus]KAK0787166.1 hypothetical protein LTR59_010417 [Friedmanniomyces endolithicus]KAK0840649.1 hypothetical protein LTR03_010449 [Friedmanniomyces endolithicus]KAK0868127.1 hypothetical protein LTR87_014297 [Friedmanniomyces endolithicus]KAK0903403.1 hypothetical protein LTR02_007629 [Friedmanniomyces endolithicus]